MDFKVLHQTFLDFFHLSYLIAPKVLVFSVRHFTSIEENLKCHVYFKLKSSNVIFLIFFQTQVKHAGLAWIIVFPWKL